MLMKFKTKPWEHQLEALDFAIKTEQVLFNIGLGCGKSKLTIDLIANSDVEHALIVCPLAVVAAWELQFELHCSVPYKITILNKGSVKTKLAKAQKDREVASFAGILHVIVINVDGYWREPMGTWLLRKKIPLVVIDEIHKIKSPGGKASRFAGRLGRTASRRIGLSGTPLAHSPLDAYGEFRFLDPSIYGKSFTRFRSAYAVMGGFEGRVVIGYQNERDFNEKFHSITFTRDRSVIKLPMETHVTIPIELSNKVMKLYRELELEFVAEVEDGTVTVQNALTKLLRLQQITSGHIIKDDEEKATILHSEKEQALMTLMDGMEKDEPLVVFCRFRADLNSVHRAAEASGRRSLELSGTRKELERWQAGEAVVIAVQIQSGSEGITLVRACYAVYYSIGFSLSQYEQSLARICRPGQERPCIYYHLVCKGTVDQKVYRALKQRKRVIEDILREIKAP